MRFVSPRALFRVFGQRSLWLALGRGLFSKASLPPGKLIVIEGRERRNRRFVLEQSNRLGPVFKGLGWGGLWICVVGLRRGRRLLREQGAVLQPVTIQLSSLFPGGFLRQMRGAEHRGYRQALMAAVRSPDFAAQRPVFEDLARRELMQLAGKMPPEDEAETRCIEILNTVASGMLVSLFYGFAPGSKAFAHILALYRRLGPRGLVWLIGEPQHAAFAELRDYLREAFPADEAEVGPSSSILGRVHEEGPPDETLLGNLIYMVEMGRYDLGSLFRWLLSHAAIYPELMERIREEGAEDASPEGSLADAFVRETLRLDQSERLLRRVEREFVFDGYRFPRDAMLRICLWESHKSGEAFAEPFRFDPDRFLRGLPEPEEYAPFGLDPHRCPFGEIVVRMGTVFLRVLSHHYTVETLGETIASRGAYTWEPTNPAGFRLRPRDPAVQFYRNMTKS